MKPVSALSAAFLAACSEIFAVELSFTRPETIVAEFATEAEAGAARISVAPLHENRKLAFTSRWDDSTPAHEARAEMFARVGMQPMFFINGGESFAKTSMPKIKAAGGRFGNHSASHPFLMESGVNRMFNEVMLQKIFIECSADTPNTSFAIPYSWSCQLEPGRAAKLAKILVDAGIFVSSDWPLAEAAQPASEWMPGRTFSANDGDPDEKRYRDGVAGGVAAIEKDPDYPKLTFGIHSWCRPEGLLKQEAWLKETVAEHKDDWWITDDAHYGAYRYEFWHAETRKLGVKGRTATFEVLRHDPAYLGEVQPLTYEFGGVAPVGISVSGGFPAETAMPEKIDRMRDGASEEFPGLSLRVAVDEEKGELAYRFEGEGAKVVSVLINPAPMWSNSRILEKDPAGVVKLGVRNTLPDYLEGDRLYVAGVDFIKDGRRGRLYATETVEGAASPSGGTPRDCTLVLGPVDPDAFDAGKLEALSVPEATLPNQGDGIHQYWRSMADKRRCGFSAAAYVPWDAGVPADFKEAVKNAKPADRPFFLAAVDFVCGADGEKDLLVNRAKWEKTEYWLNGGHVETKGGVHRVRVRKGLNRLIYRWEWFQPWHPQAFLLSVCDDADVDKAVEFVAPKTEKRDGVFESDGFAVEFANDGRPRPPTYAGRAVFEGFNYENGKTLSKKDGCAAKPVYRRTADALVCTVDCPLGAASDDFAYRTSYTVTKDSFSFEGRIRVKKGVSWKGANATSTIYAPIEFFAGRRISIVTAKGESKEFDYPKEFDPETCKLPGFKTLDNGEWTLTLDNALPAGFYDRRQWNNPSSSIQICPDGGLDWNGKTSDGTEYVWKWTLKHR